MSVVLGLQDAPVIAAERLEIGKVPGDGGIEARVQLLDHQPVGELLGLLPVFDCGEGVVLQLVGDVGAELRGQPVVTVQVKQRAERAPRRNRQETEPEHLVDEVEVVVQALAAVTANDGATGLLVVPRLVRRTRFHRREDVHQPGTVATLDQDLLNAIFLPEALHALDELDRHAFPGRYKFGVSANGLAERQRELLGVIE